MFLFWCDWVYISRFYTYNYKNLIFIDLCLFVSFCFCILRFFFLECFNYFFLGGGVTQETHKLQLFMSLQLRKKSQVVSLVTKNFLMKTWNTFPSILDHHVCEAIEYCQFSNILSVNERNVLYGTEIMHRGYFGPVFFFRQH